MDISFLTVHNLPIQTDTSRLFCSAGRNRFVAAACVAALGFLATMGCGKVNPDRAATFPVTGMLSFRGQPANGAFVSLHPQNGAASNVPIPRASVDPDGSFALSTYEAQDGAPEGDYVLTVKWYKPVKVNGDFVGGPNTTAQG